MDWNLLHYDLSGLMLICSLPTLVMACLMISTGLFDWMAPEIEEEDSDE